MEKVDPDLFEYDPSARPEPTDDEVFGDYLEMELTPEDLSGNERADYAAWLKKREQPN